jgi:hypothetical protein
MSVSAADSSSGVKVVSADVNAQNIANYVTTHDIFVTQSCQLTENRFKIKDVDGQQDLFCWKGIINQGSGSCKIGSICSPYSYAVARSAFCLTWGNEPGGCGAPDAANLYVSNQGTVDAGIPAYNVRGGVIVYNSPGTCKGLTGDMGCILGGLRQSFTNALDPANRTHLILSTLIFFGVLLATALFWRKYKKKFKIKKVDVFKH